MSSNTLGLLTYGALTFFGAMHFVVDVVSQKLRGVRAPGIETTLYYGLNTCFSLGQVALGTLGVWVLLTAPAFARSWPMSLVPLFAGVGWLVVTFLFMEYREPRIAMSVFVVIALANGLSRFASST